jgi:dephospho-CoA kinase
METTTDRLVRILDEERTNRTNQSKLSGESILKLHRENVDLRSEKYKLERIVEDNQHRLNNLRSQVDAYVEEILQWQDFAKKCQPLLRRGKKLPKQPPF